MTDSVVLDAVAAARPCCSTEPPPARAVRRAARKAGRPVTLDDIRTGPPTLDIPAACGLIGISRSYGFELAKRGEFPCRLLKVGTRYRVPRTALLALLEGSPAGETA